MRGFASQTKPDLGSGRFPWKEQRTYLAVDVVGEAQQGPGCVGQLFMSCLPQHPLASLCRDPTTETGQSWDTGPLLVTALLPLLTQVVENRWKRGLVGTVFKTLHLLCRKTFPDVPAPQRAPHSTELPVDHITVAFLQDAPEYLSRGCCSLLTKVGGFP